MPVSVALLQIDVSSSEAPDAREARVLNMIAEAAAGAQLLLLPELWHVGAFDMRAARLHAQAIDGPLAQHLAAAARAHGIWLHAGSIAERDSAGRLFNTSLLFDPRGSLVASYRKIHLFGFQAGESAVMSGGVEVVTATTPLGVTGIATCYDLRFPELFRALTQEGAEATLIASGWPQSRIEQWSVLLRARAIENQSWVLACNEVGVQDTGSEQISLGGYSAVISPSGEVLASGAGEEGIIHTRVDPAAVTQLRASFPVLGDIRMRSILTDADPGR